MTHQVFELARFGMTDKEIAEFYGMNVNTVDNWKRTKKEFSEALQEGRIISSLKVIQSLYKRACGFYYTETHEEYKTTSDGIEVLANRKEIKKYSLPNVTSGIYIMKARHGDKWADVYETKITGNINFSNIPRPDLIGLTTNEKQLLKSISLKQLSLIHGSGSN
jgi:hypothetical protein